MRPKRSACLLALAALLLAAPLAPAQAPARTLTALELSLAGVDVTLADPAPVVPKGLRSAVLVEVRSGARLLSTAEVKRFLGGAQFRVEGDLRGPGLAGTLSLPEPPEPGAQALLDSLVLPLPPLPVAGNYELSNLRIVADGRAALDVEPSAITVRVIDQVLVTRVTTRPLTLDEIRQRGIVLDSDDYLAFEFNLALRLQSDVVSLQFPVVFDRQGVAVPLELIPPGPPLREGVKLPQIRAVLLKVPADDGGGGGGGGPEIKLETPEGEPVTIPGLIVIPGDVGYLKQFFSARLYVANGAPQGSGLTVRDVRGRIQLPPGPDGVPGNEDDPLALPEILRDGVPVQQPVEMTVLGLGPDEEPGTADDEPVLQPHEEGQAEFLLRGESEGFHPLGFEISAVLDGLRHPDGQIRPVEVRGSASGGVLVRNPYFDLTFTVPTVVRDQEPFKLFVTVTNIGQGDANDFYLRLDAGSLSHTVQLLDEEERRIPTLARGQSQTLEFNFLARATGQVIAKYLKLSGASAGGHHGRLRFELGIGERGVPLSPDTLQLPAAVNELPADLVRAAMRVLGQAWSVAKAPLGSLPSNVRRIDERVVIAKALTLAEAGLRVSLGQSSDEALRDLLLDLWRLEQVHPDSPPDEGFDQLLRSTEAGRNLAIVLGQRLAGAVGQAGGPLGFEQRFAEVGSSGPDFVSFAVDSGSSRVAELSLSDPFGNTLRLPPAGWLPESQVRSAVVVPSGSTEGGAVLGYVSAPQGAYLVELAGREHGSASLSASLPSPDGHGFVRARISGLTVRPGSRTLVALDPFQPERVLVSEDLDGNGVMDGPPVAHATSPLASAGPRLIAAGVIGEETFASASPWGVHAAALFDRPVGAESASAVEHYSMADNVVRSARRQLSGRLVFLLLRAPEGRHQPASLTASGLRDLRGNAGPTSTVDLVSRLAAPGGVVSGRVLTAEGDPVSGVDVVYLNTPDWADECVAVPSRSGPEVLGGIAAVPVDAAGTFTLRYVRQHSHGCPFHLVTRDPVSGAQRYVSARIRGDGDRLVRDIVFFGAGKVRGVVRNRATGQVVAGAAVTVRSLDDQQIGMRAVTALDGSYEVRGITVGPVTAHAAKGIGSGFASGRIPTAGGTATVDVELDDGAVNIGGKVTRFESGTTTPATGALVVAYFGGVPVGWQFADAEGRYLLRGMPVGSFQVTAQWELLHSRREGVALAGQHLLQFDLPPLATPPGQVTRDVAGRVFLSGGAPAASALVSISSVATAVLTDADGRFRITDVPVPPQPRNDTVSARTLDGRRTGSAPVQVTSLGQIPGPEDLRITLSGVGQAQFTVLGPDNLPVKDVQVSLPGACTNPCGCATRVTGPSGIVTFENLPVGSVSARAFRSLTGYVDYVEGRLDIPGDGQTGYGVLRFGGVGKVRVKVRDEAGDPVGASDVTLRTLSFQYDPTRVVCGLEESIRTLRTSITPLPGQPVPGEVEFANLLVAANGYSVSATNPNALGAVVREGGRLAAAGAVNRHTLTVVDRMAGKLSGYVYLPDGTTPAEGVEVSLGYAIPDYMVSTNASGRYEFAAVLPAGTYRLSARDTQVARGLGQVEAFVALPVGEDRAFDLRLLGRAPVAVRVVDGLGQAVPSAQVRLQESGFPRKLYTRALEPAHQGTVSFDAVYEGSFSVEVKDPVGRGGRATGVVTGPGQRAEVTVVLSSTGCVYGRFRMPDGSTPIPYGVVRLLGGAFQQEIGLVTAEGPGPAAGSFAFDFVPFGNVRIEAQDPLTARRGVAAGQVDVEAHLGDPAPQCLQLDVLAEALGSVTGMVRSNGAPQPGLEVQVASGSHYRVRTLSTQDGSYLVEGVPAGQVTATALPPGGYLMGQSTGTLLGEGQTLTLDVALRDSVDVAGQLLAAGGRSRAGLAGAGVGRGCRCSLPRRAGLQRRGGQLPVRATASGTPALRRAAVAGHRPRARRGRPGAARAGAGDDRDERCRPPAGRAEDAAGNPVAGYVSVTGTGAFYYEYGLQVGSTGEFVIDQLLSGPVSLRLTSRPGGVTLHGSATASVPTGGQTESVVVRLQPSGSLKGRLLRSDGQAAYGAAVTISGQNSMQVRTQANGSGDFTVVGLPLGTYSGRVVDPLTGGLAVLPTRQISHDGQAIDYGTVQLDDGAPHLAFVVPAAGAVSPGYLGPLEIEASDPGGLDLASLVVRYPSGAAQYAAEFQLGADGRFRGLLKHAALVEGLNRLVAELADVSGNRATTEVVFTVLGATISGHVTLPEGGPAVGAPVTLGSRSTVADANGNYSFTGLREGTYTVEARDPRTQLAVRRTTSVSDGGSATVDLPLPVYGSVAGVVEDAFGTAVVGAAVVLSGARHDTTVSGPGGAFAFAGVPLGSFTVDVTTGDGDRGRATGSLSVPLGTATANVSLTGRGSVNVEVRSGGVPRAGLTVTLSTTAPWGAPARRPPAPTAWRASRRCSRERCRPRPRSATSRVRRAARWRPAGPSGCCSTSTSGRSRAGSSTTTASRPWPERACVWRGSRPSRGRTAASAWRAWRPPPGTAWRPGWAAGCAACARD